MTAASVILEMIRFLIINTISTIIGLFRLFFDLISSLTVVSGSGFGGFVLSVIIIALVVFFLGKFVLRMGKGLMILIIIGIILAWIVILLMYHPM